MAWEGEESYNSTPAVVVVEPGAEEEFDALAELTAQEGICQEEYHEETMECLHRLEAQVTALAEHQSRLQQALTEIPQTDSPLLAQVQAQLEVLRAQQAETIAQLVSLKESTSQATQSLSPPQHSHSQNHQEAPGEGRTEVSTVEPSEVAPAPQEPPKRRLRVL